MKKVLKSLGFTFLLALTITGNCIAINPFFWPLSTFVWELPYAFQEIDYTRDHAGDITLHPDYPDGKPYEIDEGLWGCAAGGCQCWT